VTSRATPKRIAVIGLAMFLLGATVWLYAASSAAFMMPLCGEGPNSRPEMPERCKRHAPLARTGIAIAALGGALAIAAAAFAARRRGRVQGLES